MLNLMCLEKNLCCRHLFPPEKLGSQSRLTTWTYHPPLNQTPEEMMQINQWELTTLEAWMWTSWIPSC